MTPAEQMRERAAAEVEAADEMVITRADLAAAIRALPLPEEAGPTAQEKLRRVREARELLATARVAVVPRGAGYVTDEATGRRLGDWRDRSETYVNRRPRATAVTMRNTTSGMTDDERRTWVLDTLRAEGWDVVEEGTVQDG